LSDQTDVYDFNNGKGSKSITKIYLDIHEERPSGYETGFIIRLQCEMPPVVWDFLNSIEKNGSDNTQIMLDYVRKSTTVTELRERGRFSG
jgi:hypothetical protein